MNHLAKDPQHEIALHVDKVTDTAFIDILPLPTGRVDVVDVTDILDLGTTVLARVDECGNVLGLTIMSYKRFRREVMRKYITFAVERIITLLVDRVRVAFTHTNSTELVQHCA